MLSQYLQTACTIVETFSRVHYRGYDDTGKCKQMFTKLLINDMINIYVRKCQSVACANHALDFCVSFNIYIYIYLHLYCSTIVY